VSGLFLEVGQTVLSAQFHPVLRVVTPGNPSARIVRE
jgi:hypothetical protein